MVGIQQQCDFVSHTIGPQDHGKQCRGNGVRTTKTNNIYLTTSLSNAFGRVSIARPIIWQLERKLPSPNKILKNEFNSIKSCRSRVQLLEKSFRRVHLSMRKMRMGTCTPHEIWIREKMCAAFPKSGFNVLEKSRESGCRGRKESSENVLVSGSEMQFGCDWVCTASALPR